MGCELSAWSTQKAAFDRQSAGSNAQRRVGCLRKVLLGILAERGPSSETEMHVVLGSNNREDLTTPERLQIPSHTFSDNSGQHTANVLYAPHPSSLRRYSAREQARFWYQKLGLSLNASIGQS